MKGKNGCVRRKRLELDVSPSDLFSALSEENDGFLLESAEFAERIARYSFIGFSPKKCYVLKKGRLLEDGKENGLESISGILRNEYGANSSNNGSGAKRAGSVVRARAQSSSNRGSGGGTKGMFLGGLVGYFSFEHFRNIEDIKMHGNCSFPEAEFGLFEDVIEFDHAKNSVNYIFRGEDRSDEVLRIAKDFSFESVPIKIKSKRTNMGLNQYVDKVEKAKEYIRNGDIFQTIISRKYELGYSGGLASFYKRLKAINPSPYMFYLKFKDRQIVGASPENLVRVNGNKVESYATLAGTRRRGSTPKEDKLLERELLRDGKELAEHSMLVDLTRNDVGKIAELGSVKVKSLMKVLKFSHVMHISSFIEARKRKGVSSVDVFNSIFPAGTVSGAPKIRAIEIINELENEARGPYGGAVGYFSENGNCDFAIGIRTLYAEKNKLTIQAGAGIVYDSVPEREFVETENKLGALLQALGEKGEKNDDKNFSKNKGDNYGK